MPAYSHLSDEERDQIGMMMAAGRSIGAIAKALACAKSTISRELRRNALESGRYSRILVLDDAESLQRGKFRKELQLLCDLLHRRGWRAELGCPAEVRWEGQQLLLKGQAVSFPKSFHLCHAQR